MKLTKKKAIEISIELWTWLAKTGRKYKSDWPRWKEYGRMQDDCALCECFIDCDICPIDCYETYFCEWDGAKNKNERKKYAKLFLKQLEQL